MPISVQFHYDFGSPNAYLSHLVLPALEERTGISVQYVPVLLGGIFKATGNASPAVTLQGIKNKGPYQHLETERFLRAHSITDYQPNPFFPVNTLNLMRGAIVAERGGYPEKYTNEVFRHMWAAPKKMDDPEVFAEALKESDLPVDDILRGIQDPDVKAALIANTEQSVERGAFGAPSFFVGDELFFGKDKLRDVEDEIRAQQSGVER